MAFKVDIKSKPVTPGVSQLQEEMQLGDFTTGGLFRTNNINNNWHNEVDPHCCQQQYACIAPYAASMYMYPSSESESESEGSF